MSIFSVLRVRRRFAIPLAATVAVAALTGGNLVRQSQADAADAAVTVKSNSLLSAITARETDLQKAFDAAQAATTRTSVDAGVSPDVRSALQTSAATLGAEATHELSTLEQLRERVVTLGSHRGFWPGDDDSALRALGRVKVPTGAPVATLQTKMTTAGAAYETAVDVAGQQRLLAQAAAEAAKAAAQQKAQARVTPGPQPSVSPAPAPQQPAVQVAVAPSDPVQAAPPQPKSSPITADGVRHVTVRVLMSGVSVTAVQAQIDAGGQIAATYPGMTIVISHNFNDDVALGLAPSDIVQFTGAITGTFKATGSVDVPKGSSTALLRPLKSRMIIGTCNWTSNTEHFVGLTQIGA